MSELDALMIVKGLAHQKDEGWFQWWDRLTPKTRSVDWCSSLSHSPVLFATCKQ